MLGFSVKGTCGFFLAEIVKKTTRIHHFFKCKSYDILLSVALKGRKEGKEVTDN